MRYKVPTKRGRPPSGYHSHDDIRLLEYLAKISVTHEIDSDQFFRSFLEAFQHDEATCGELTIICRKKTKVHAIFLISKNHQVIAQFPIPQRILAKTTPLKEFTDKLAPPRNTPQNPTSGDYPIETLRVGMRKINVKARVLEVSQPRVVATRFGHYVNVSNAIITDETGDIQLPLWNKQIDDISAGDLIQVENANVILFKGVRQLKVGRTGKVSLVKNR